MPPILNIYLKTDTDEREKRISYLEAKYTHANKAFVLYQNALNI